MKFVTAIRPTLRLSCFAALISLISTSGAQGASEKNLNPTGKIFVAETDGVSTIHRDDRIVELIAKSVYIATGSIIETQSDANAAIVYSNGTGISLEPETELEIIQFKQAPFPLNRPNLELEPSISQTQARLNRGSVVISTGQLAAGSTMNYQTRHIDVAIQGGKLIIETNDTRTTITVLAGSTTLRDRSRPGGQSLLVGQQAIITRASTFEQPIITIRQILENEQQGLDQKTAMATMARRTVYFEVEESNNRNTDSTLTQNVFNRNELEEDVLIPVTVLPGAIPGPNTVSPFKITRTVVR